jgi:hypothetical protein
VIQRCLWSTHITVHRYTHTLWFSVFTSRTLATGFNTVIITRKVFFSQDDFQISTELVSISSQSSSTAVSKDSLNSNSAGLGSSLYRLGSAPTENTVSDVIAQQYFDCCLRISCRGNLFTASLPSNERLLWLRYPAFRRHVTVCTQLWTAFFSFFIFRSGLTATGLARVYCNSYPKPLDVDVWIWGRWESLSVRVSETLLLMHTLNTILRWC